MQCRGTTYADAQSFALGSRMFLAGGGFGAAADASPSGRKVTSTSFNDGIISSNDLGRFVAIVDSVNSRLLARGPVVTTQPVISGQQWSLASFSITIPSK
jgi:hypothetical protein